jgi:hypothetical protein
LQIKTKIVSCHVADPKPVKEEVNSTVILFPLVFPVHSTVMHSGAKHNDVMHSAVMNSVTVHSVVKHSAFMNSVIMLNVVSTNKIECLYLEKNLTA